MTVISTEALSRVDQVLLQRLMASHVLEDKEAKLLLSEIQAQDEETEDPKNLEECFAAINQQMTKGFGLEIATVVLNSTKYHAVMNSHADEMSKKSFDHHFDAHDRQFILLVLQHLVDSSSSSSSASSASSAQRRDLYNLRGELQEPYKMTLTGAEHVVESLIQQQWLQVCDSSSSSSSSIDPDRRTSLQATLELAPRTYLELSHLLVDMGIPQDDLPQFLFHRL